MRIRSRVSPAGPPSGSRSRPSTTATERIAKLPRRVPSAGRWCFAVAFLNVLIWTFVIPPFQVPDEISHFGYTQYLAEVGRPPPQGPVGQYSPQEQNMLDALSFVAVVGHPAQRGIMNSVEEAGLREELAAKANPVGEGGSSSATDEPPLYYALEAVPYLALAFPRHPRASGVDAGAVGADGGADGAVHVHVPARADAGHTVGVDGRGAGRRLSADVRLHRGGRSGRQSACSWPRRRAFLDAGARLSSRPDAADGRARSAWRRWSGVLAKLTFVALAPGYRAGGALLGWRAWPSGRRQALRAVGGGRDRGGARRCSMRS